ncbi:protein kinase domain-containing protein [Nonomuraea sp. PA05]|uniref:protein kinase domain-containing protein n=1 Tax=Nonomuraea sp. PA05 TaxID=2604466 RepID=UPI0016526DFE|nr:protein kinase [Nonomuraea sp. PA05]
MAHVEPLREDDPTAAGPHRLLGRLGSGGQGTVYLGQAPDGRAVAVKVLRDGHAGLSDRLAKEIEAARRVEPFCIAQVLDASLSGPRPYIVTEYVEGPSLQQAGLHTGADLQRLAVATATALTAIHQAGIVHRDFKPANVLLGPGGPRVIDFGIARALDDGVTHTSSIVGTPAYMAPEQLAGQAVGAAADVFAWASVMVWAGTGTPPFGQDTLPAIINRILHNEPQLGDLGQPLRGIVYGCLVKDPLRRPAMRDVLLRLLSGQNATPGPGSGAHAGPGPHTGPGSHAGPGPRPGPGLHAGPGSHAGLGSHAAPMPGAGPIPGGGPMPSGHPVQGAGHMPGQGPVPSRGPMPGQGPMPNQGPMPGVGVGPGHRASKGTLARVGVPAAVGVAVVMVVALVAGVVWLSPWARKSGPESLAAVSSASPTTSPTSTDKRTHRSSTPSPRKTTRKTQKPTRTPTPRSTPKPTQTPTTRSPAPSRTTKKPVTSAKVSILEIELFGGPGQSTDSSCYMPPIHFQTMVESTRPGIWVSYLWIVDGQTRENRKSWVPEDDYTAFVTAGQYMLDEGRHTITLRVTEPSAASKSVTINICPVDDYS